MTGIAIRVQNLSKLYRIGARQERHDMLRDALTTALRGVDKPSQANTFCALKDISFEVKRGEAVGVIGRNGAGKSTLLRILSRITEPTHGYAEIHGRVGSLLEVGTGFHPELTGRDNIYLNGAILGMRRREIACRFDEIVAFAEIDQFLDTPVKRYSSGMYVRLAFAVAAHLEPEILLVDEVLAVGDAEFQRKCLGKMSDVAHEGRTVLFVSHSMTAIQRLCERSILLQQGALALHGPTLEVTKAYLGTGTRQTLTWEREVEAATVAYLAGVAIRDAQQQFEWITTSSGVTVRVEFVMTKRMAGLQLSINLLDASGGLIAACFPQDDHKRLPQSPGRYCATMTLPGNVLLPQEYAIQANLWTQEDGGIDRTEPLRFSVHEAGTRSTSVPAARLGAIVLPGTWTIGPWLPEKPGCSVR